MSGARCPASFLIQTAMLDRIKHLVYRPDFFAERTFTANQGMTFYSLAILTLVIGIILTMLPGAYRMVHSMRSGEWNAQRATVASLYPDDLVVNVRGGVISTNQPNPVVAPVPREWQMESKCKKSYQDCRVDAFPTNLIAIDTDRAVSTDSFDRYQSVVVIGQHDIGFRNPERGEIRIFNLRDSGFRETFKVDENLFTSWVDRGFAFARAAVIALIVVAPVFIYLGLWIGYLAYALLGALVVMIAAHIQGHTLAFGRAYLSTLYLYPVPFAFSFLMSFSHHHIPFVFTLILFVMALVNFPKAPKLPAPVKIATADAPVVPKDAVVEEKLSEKR